MEDFLSFTSRFNHSLPKNRKEIREVYIMALDAIMTTNNPEDPVFEFMLHLEYRMLKYNKQTDFEEKLMIRQYEIRYPNLIFIPPDMDEQIEPIKISTLPLSLHDLDLVSEHVWIYDEFLNIIDDDEEYDENVVDPHPQQVDETIDNVAVVECNTCFKVESACGSKQEPVKVDDVIPESMTNTPITLTFVNGADADYQLPRDSGLEFVVARVEGEPTAKRSRRKRKTVRSLNGLADYPNDYAQFFSECSTTMLSDNVRPSLFGSDVIKIDNSTDTSIGYQKVKRRITNIDVLKDYEFKAHTIHLLNRRLTYDEFKDKFNFDNPFEVLLDPFYKLKSYQMLTENLDVMPLGLLSYRRMMQDRLRRLKKATYLKAGLTDSEFVIE